MVSEGAVVPGGGMDMGWYPWVWGGAVAMGVVWAMGGGKGVENGKTGKTVSHPRANGCLFVQNDRNGRKWLFYVKYGHFRQKRTLSRHPGENYVSFRQKVSNWSKTPVLAIYDPIWTIWPFLAKTGADYFLNAELFEDFNHFAPFYPKMTVLTHFSSPF